MLLASLPGVAQRINPITKAVLDGYTEIIRENPKDYETLYQRAVQYYNLSLYDQALADAEAALRYTPEKNNAILREQEYSLLSDIYIQQKQYEKAFDAVSKALALEPDSYANTYKLGNVCLYLNKPEEAYAAFKTMQRMKSRSQEAFFGMARASIMLGNKSEAESLMKEAENADPSNYLTYCRLGDLCRELGEPEKAATNYLAAYSMANDPRRPLESLVDLSRKSPDAVNRALDYAISRSDSKLPLYYMKASLSLESGNYRDAENAAQALLKLPDGLDASVYRMLALSQHAQQRHEEAAANMDMAIKYRPDSENEVIKAGILLATDPKAALEYTEKAVRLDADYVPALITGAKANIMLGDGDKALALLNSAVMIDPGNLEALTLRGYVNSNLLNDGKLGVMDYQRAAAGESDAFPEFAYQALAKAKAGKQLDGDAIIEKALAADSGKDACYYAAVYYAQTGRLDKSVEMAGRAISQGFQNNYLLYESKEPGFNLQPIRHLLKQ